MNPEQQKELLYMFKDLMDEAEDYVNYEWDGPSEDAREMREMGLDDLNNRGFF